MAAKGAAEDMLLVSTKYAYVRKFKPAFWAKKEHGEIIKKGVRPGGSVWSVANDPTESPPHHVPRCVLRSLRKMYEYHL